MGEQTKLPVGIENFEEIRSNGYYYIDKTKLIEQLLDNRGKSEPIHPSSAFWKNTQYEYAEMLF